MSVGTSAARLDAGGDGTVTAQNVGAVDVSLGNASVTTSDGFKLAPGASYSADLRTSAPGGPSTSAWTGDTLYGVVASGTCVVHVIRHGV